jgi:hypothetical protein
MLRVLVLLLALSGTATELDQRGGGLGPCDPAAKRTAKTDGVRLAQQCVPGNCCGQMGCWIQCPCW